MLEQCRGCGVRPRQNTPAAPLSPWQMAHRPRDEGRSPSPAWSMCVYVNSRTFLTDGSTHSSFAEELDFPLWCSKDDRHSFTSTGHREEYEQVNTVHFIKTTIPIEFQEIQNFIFLFHTTLGLNFFYILYLTHPFLFLSLSLPTHHINDDIIWCSCRKHHTQFPRCLNESLLIRRRCPVDYAPSLSLRDDRVTESQHLEEVKNGIVITSL